jgi:DNA mismatch endonuclease (patch repair protein)
VVRDPAITHKIMSAVKSKNTRPEITLRKALWRQGLRFRVNYKGLPGKPDIVFTKAKVAVFCDGDYWHGHNWALRGLRDLDEELAGYSEFWVKKILGNIQRDDEVNRQLTELGWKVVRVWESEINSDVSECVRRICETYITAHDSFTY